MSITRRRFIKTAGTIALASIAHPLPVFSGMQNSLQNNSRIAVFFEPSFPAIDGLHIDQTILQQACKDLNPTFISAHDLSVQLLDFDLLIMPYGSAFPKEAWKVILDFLKNGGNLVNLGGIPVSVPVDQD